MGFNNLDNTKIFDDFWDKYGQSLQHIDDIIVESSDDVSDINNPYGIDKSQVPMTIKRYSNPCSRFNFSQGEEFALIAHELGHAYIQENSIQCNGFEEECKADDYVVKLGLGNDLKSALTNIFNNFQDSVGILYDAFSNVIDPKKELKERIDRL